MSYDKPSLGRYGGVLGVGGVPMCQLPRPWDTMPCPRRCRRSCSAGQRASAGTVDAGRAGARREPARDDPCPVPGLAGRVALMLWWPMLLWSGGRSGLVLVRLPRGAWARLLDEAACRWATVEEIGRSPR